MGKRYHYDAKGRYKGKSSSTFIADGKTFRMIGIMLFIGVMGNMLFGTYKPKVEQQSQATASVGGSHLDTEPIKTSANPQVNVSAPPLPEEPITRDEAPPVVINTTADYMHRQYVNGDSNCPRDIVEYHQTQCDAGDLGSCSAALCGREE